MGGHIDGIDIALDRRAVEFDIAGDVLRRRGESGSRYGAGQGDLDME
jgi:hypothetical protein